MTPIERGERAKELLADPVLKSVFADIRERLVLKLEAMPFDAVETQHEVALMLQLLLQVRQQLQTYTNEVLVDQAKQKHESFIQKMRQRLA